MNDLISREEAAKRLEALAEQREGSFSGEAFAFAAKIVRGVPSALTMGDLISKKALLAEYDRVHVGPPGGARKLIEDAPAVQQWIPVTERLPEYGQIVLAFGKRHATSGMFRGTTSNPKFWHWKGNMYKEVSHWMPLPQPPKGE